MVGRRSPQMLGGLVSVGPLLAVLMSRQQGEGGVRSFNTRRNTGFFARYRRSLEILDVSGAETGPPVASRAAAKYRAGR